MCVRSTRSRNFASCKLKCNHKKDETSLVFSIFVIIFTGTAGDSFSTQKGMAFSTKDSDNDAWSSSCAVRYKGGWWYGACHGSNLNGLYHHGTHSSDADGINWKNWKGYYYSLKFTSMKIRPRKFGLKK